MVNPIWALMNMCTHQNNRTLLWFLALCVAMHVNLAVHAQSTFRIIAYNVENLFDCRNDSLTNDDVFLPNSMRAWTYARYQHKLASISKVVAAIGEWDTPMLVGLCEVENEYCLKDLCKHGVLQSYGYDIVHYDSPDRRGIDVALLYNAQSFSLLTSEAIRVGDDLVEPFYTRDILYVKGIVGRIDTLHTFLCHFPSRWSGKRETEHLRMIAAAKVRQRVDSIMRDNAHALIMVMGDFNDAPSDKCMAQTLNALPMDSVVQEHRLYNLMWHHSRMKDTHYYQGQWNCFDQIVVSGALLKGNQRLQVKESGAQVFKPDFLLIDDEKYLQRRPWRTYNGMKYWGGFSDHLPIYVDLEIKE